MKRRVPFVAATLAAFVGGFVFTSAQVCAQIYVTQYQGSIGKYALDGTPINPLLVPWPSPAAYGIAATEESLFVATPSLPTHGITRYDAATGAVISRPLVQTPLPVDVVLVGDELFTAQHGSVGHYTTSGAVLNHYLITGLDSPRGVFVADGSLWVANFSSGTIGKYNTAGQTINASLVADLHSPVAVAVADGRLYVLNSGDEGTPGSVGVYNADTGATIDDSLISGLEWSQDMACFAGNLYIAQTGANRVSQYSIMGQLLDEEFIFADSPRGIAIVPETSTSGLAGALTITVLALPSFAGRPRKTT